MQLLPSIDGPSLYKAKTKPMESLSKGLTAVQKPSSAFLQRQGFSKECLDRYEHFIESLKSKGYAQLNQEELIELSIIKEVILGILEILKIPPVPLQWAPPFTETAEEKTLNTTLNTFTLKIQGFIQEQQETLPDQHGYRAPHFDLRLLYAQMRDSIRLRIKSHKEEPLESIENKVIAHYLVSYHKWRTLLKQVVQVENEIAYLKVKQKGKFHMRLYLFNKRIKSLSIKLMRSLIHGTLCFKLRFSPAPFGRGLG
ncbi:MAG: hypothetical protein ACK551_06705 [Vampirovibrionales bacterium]